MEEKTPWTIITRYLRNEATPEEKAILKKWLEEDSVNRKTFDELSGIFQLTTHVPQPITPDKQKAWKRIESRITGARNPVPLIFRRLNYSAAAVGVMLIGIALYLIVNQQINYKNMERQFTEIVAPPGQKTKITLPDSSLVWLNSGSSLKYNGHFNLKEREVILEGEGFFEVRRDASKKFRVRTGILDVVVYGTSFNIKNHADDHFQEITVSGGTVGVWNNGKEIRQLSRNDQALLDKTTNKITFQKEEAEMVAAWKNNELVFDNTPIVDVIKYLERWYGVNITIDEAMKKKHSYTFKVKTESFREMLLLMKKITPMTCEINGKEVKIKYAN